jgi:hypothetical protein
MRYQEQLFGGEINGLAEKPNKIKPAAVEEPSTASRTDIHRSIAQSAG